MHIHFLLTQDLECPSGLGRYWPLAKELNKIGYIVTISALHSNYQQLQHKTYTKDGVKIKYLSPMHVKKQGSNKYYYSTLRLLVISIRATLSFIINAMITPADIILIGKPHPMNSIAGILLKAILKKKVILDCDDYEVGINIFNGIWQKKIIEFFENWMPHKVDFITTNTRFNYDRLIKLDIPENKIIYIPNGIDPTRFEQPDLIEINKIKDKYDLTGKLVIAYIGTLGTKSHPVNLLLESFPIIKETIPNSILLLVGGGEDFQVLFDRSKDLKNFEDIIFTGRIPPDQIPKFYAVSNISVDPVFDDITARGRSPLKIFESWFCGVPITTGNVGDRSYLLGNPPAGLLIKPGSSKDLADGILKILSDQSLANSYIDLGYKRVKAFFWEKLTKEMIEALPLTYRITKQ